MIGGIDAIIMPIITGALSDVLGILADMGAIVLMVICMVLNGQGKQEKKSMLVMK
ncbi:hypothetical protein [Geosporobacter ferrireducens]|uniref:hypothetical protein n=1 Tax=Geosporobacter ferrireducens TaxID=1424294 RepID=UPI0023541B75|nr:hypothetical protein [Geosporobacter ferrireducens]